MVLAPLDFQTFRQANLLRLAENAIYFQPVFIMCCLEKVAGGNCSWACTVVRGESFLAFFITQNIIKFEIRLSFFYNNASADFNSIFFFHSSLFSDIKYRKRAIITCS